MLCEKRFVATQDYDDKKPSVATMDHWIDRLIGDRGIYSEQFHAQYHAAKIELGIDEDTLVSDLDPITQYKVWERATHGIPY